MVNYFQLYDIPISFHPIPVRVKSKFYELSKKYHPDRFAQADEQARAESLRMAALNNEAYKTLTDSDRTMAYILKINGLLEDEEKYSLPPAFLMEMMDLNEIISDYEMEPDNESLAQQAKKTLETQLEQWNEEADKLTVQAEGAGMDKAILLQIKDYYFRKKYLLRIQERIDKFAAR